MKKCSLLMALLLLISMAACGTTRPQSGTENTGIAPIEECVQSTENGTYYVDEVFALTSTLIYIDYATKQEIPLCTRPECLHNDETCSSYYPSLGLSDLFVLDDYLYFFYCAGENEPTSLMRTDLAGNNREKLLEIPANYYSLPYGIYTDGQALYYMVNDTKENEEGKIVTYMTLLKIDMQKKSCEVIYQFPEDEHWHILLGPLGRKFAFSNMIIDEDDDYCTEFAWLDVDSGEMSTIQTMGKDKDAASGIYGEYLYVQDYNMKTITQTHLFTGESESFDYSSIFEGDPFNNEMMAGFELLFEDYFQIFIVDMSEEGSIFYEYFLNKNTGEITPFTLFQSFRPSQSVPIMEDLGDTLLVRPDWVMEEKTVNGYTNTFYTPRHAFISKEDYLNSVPNYEYIPTFRTDKMPGE